MTLHYKQYRSTSVLQGLHGNSTERVFEEPVLFTMFTKIRRPSCIFTVSAKRDIGFMGTFT